MPILAALLGVGVVLSPLVRADVEAPPAPGMTTRSALPPIGLAPAPQAAVRPEVAAPAPAVVPPAVAPAPVVAAVAPSAPPTIVEGVARALTDLADRPFTLVTGADPAAPRRVDGAFALDGRPVLVHVAASWCAPCAEDLPTFLALAAEAPRVVFVAAEDVAGPSGLANVFDALVARAEPSSRALPAGLELRADPDWAWAKWLGRETLPLTAVVDARGELVLVIEGVLDATAAERVRQHLAGGGA